MTQQPTSNPIWYLARVRLVTEMLRNPLRGHGAFSLDQQVFFWPLGDGDWMVFDGLWLCTLLSTAEAKVALESLRNGEGQVRLALGQEPLNERFALAMSAEGALFLCRPALAEPAAAHDPALDERSPRMQRIWYCCVVTSAVPLMSRINGSHFRAGQHGYCSQTDETSWLLFDGHHYACVLTLDQAKAALETRRDSQNQRVLAPKATEEQFLRSVYGQTGRRTRKDRRFW